MTAPRPSTQHQRRRPSGPYLLSWATATLTLLCLATPADALTAPRGPAPAVAANGRWVDAEPLNLIGAQPIGADILVTATGSSAWSGTLTGTTRFTLQALIDPAGAARGTIDETFDGTVAGTGAGTLHFLERFAQNPGGALRLTALIASGTGDLTRLDGVLHFSGFTDATGVGGGTYTGDLLDRSDHRSAPEGAS